MFSILFQGVLSIGLSFLPDFLLFIDTFQSSFFLCFIMDLLFFHFNWIVSLSLWFDPFFHLFFIQLSFSLLFNFYTLLQLVIWLFSYIVCVWLLLFLASFFEWWLLAYELNFARRGLDGFSLGIFSLELRLLLSLIFKVDVVLVHEQLFFAAEYLGVLLLIYFCKDVLFVGACLDFFDFSRTIRLIFLAQSHGLIQQPLGLIGVQLIQKLNRLIQLLVLVIFIH